MSAVSSQTVEVLIVTDNFLEAADLTEAFGTAKTDSVMHLRDLHECEPFLSDTAFRPWLCIVSYQRAAAAGLAELAQSIIARGSALVLIDAPEEDARALHAVPLARPFTHMTLSALLAQMNTADRPGA